MAPRITIVGGGSTHWTPRLLVDFVNHESLQDAEVVLMDVDEASLPPMLEVARHVVAGRATGLQVRATTSLADALDGAEYVITAFSVGGFASMRHDLEIPASYGIRQPVGDSVGPGGISRALRSVPVLLEIARAMEGALPRGAAPQRRPTRCRRCAVRRRGRRPSARSGCATSSSGCSSSSASCSTPTSAGSTRPWAA